MAAFDLSLNVIATSLAVPNEEARKQGASNVEISLAVAQELPFAQPGQPPVVAHIGNVKFVLDKKSAVEFFKSGHEAAETLPDPSDLEIATDLSSVEQAAEQMRTMRGANGS